jgi:hypothetical protein
VFAFVEGEVDRIVLSVLFGERLRAAGVELVPVHGVTNAPGIVEADILFRFTKYASRSSSTRSLPQAARSR